MKLLQNLQNYELIYNAASDYKLHADIHIRKYSNLNHPKSNSAVLGKEMKIKIDVRRNQVRMFNATQIILSYLNTMSGLNNQTISVLTKLITALEKLYRDNPNQYCNTSKGLSNWFKVNIMKAIRTQDAIHAHDWDVVMQCPSILSDIFMQLNRLTSKDQEIMVFRMVLSILDIYQVILLQGSPKLETITGGYTGKEKFWEQIDIDRALNMLGIDKELTKRDLILENRREQLHVSSAAGPNGQALWMSHVDAKAIFSDPRIKSNMEAFAKLVGRAKLFESMEDCVRMPQFFKLTQGVPKASKLHFIFEKGNKVRTIAILDWWTQEFLNPTHNVIASILRNLVNDGTFDQDKIANAVQQFTAVKGSTLYSLDLTAATDRLPIILQARILDVISGIEGYGSAWSKLIADRKFYLPDTEDALEYAVGQPMGAKSSFPMLGLTHHIIVMEAAARAGLTAFKDYVILGDDIMIANADVASKYMDIMRDLGLELSLHKSIISNDKLSRNPIAEICKRLFLNGKEITPFPIKLAVTVLESKDLAYQLQEVMYKRGLITDNNEFKLFIINMVKDNPQAAKQIALLNALPKWATGMNSQIQITTRSDYNISTWLETRGYTIEQFRQIFIFTTLVEQLKRLGAILTNTESTYTTILKAAAVSKSTGIGKDLDQYLPIETFDEDIASEWDVINIFHPAVEAVKAECERINEIIMQMSVANDTEMMNMLLSSVVDSLKISSYEIITDKAFAESKTTRKLLDTAFRNMDKLLSESRNSDTLSYSIKLGKINVIWNLSVSLTRNVSINRAAGQLSTDRNKMVSIFNDFEKLL